MVLVPDLMKSLRDQLHPLLNAHRRKRRLRPCKWSISTLARSSHRSTTQPLIPTGTKTRKGRGPLTLR